MEVCLHEAKNIPKCALKASKTLQEHLHAFLYLDLLRGDVASASDPFVEVSALGISANVVRKHLGQGFMHTILRTPAHCSTVIKDTCCGEQSCLLDLSHVLGRKHAMWHRTTIPLRGRKSLK